MKKLLLALALLLAPSTSWAQCNGVFPNNTVCGNITGASNTPRPTNPSAFFGAAGGTSGQIQYNNSGALGGFTQSGDCTTNTTTGATTCTTVNGLSPFNASNISSGTLSINRFNSGTNANTATFLRGDGTWQSILTVAATLTAPTINNAACGSLFLLGAGSTGQFTLTLPAASTVNAGCLIGFTDNDTTSGKILAGFPSGYTTNNILYPGQSGLLVSNGTIWVPIVTPGRWHKNGAQFYVATSGNATNDCLTTSTACDLPSHAYIRIVQDLDAQNGAPTVNIGAGTFTDSLTASGQLTGYNFTLFQGAGSANTIWKAGASGYCLIAQDNAEAQVSGMKFDNTGGTNNFTGIATHQTGVIDVLTDIVFGTFPGTGSVQILQDEGGFISLPVAYTIAGAAGRHIQQGPHATIIQFGPATITFSGTFTIGTMYVSQNASLVMNGTVTYTLGAATVTTQWNVDALGLIALQGSTVPGAAGSTGHGSQVF